MPELPEVETVRAGLSKFIIGQTISEVKTSWPKSLEASPADIKTKITGKTVKKVRRRGKVLMIGLVNDYTLLIHLKMTGQLVFEQAKSNQESRSERKARGRFVGGHPTKSMVAQLPDVSTRAVFTFTSGDKLFFNDQRKFGWIKLVPSSKVESEKFIKSMGPEPLEVGFRAEDFGARVKKSRAPIKAILLNQKVVAGIGNIYADEALHIAKIHPLRQGLTLTAPEVNRLHRAIITVLKVALGYGGTSFTNFVNVEGTRGNYLDYARVFRRTGQLCPVCKTKITKIRVAGRGTHVCPQCQKLK